MSNAETGEHELPIDRKRVMQVLAARAADGLTQDELDGIHDSAVLRIALWHAKEDNRMTVEEFFLAYLGEKKAEQMRGVWERYI